MILSAAGLSWTARVMGLCGFINLLAFIYLYRTSSVPYFRVTEHRVPVFKSSRSESVVMPHHKSLWPWRTYKSSPWTPVYLNVTKDKGSLAEGYLFLTAKSRDSSHEIRQKLGLVMRSDGDLVYAFNESFGMNDMRPQMINGTSHLTFWEGLSKKGHGFGNWNMMDSGYRRTSINLKAAIDPMVSKDMHLPGVLDFHEHETTPWGTVLVTAYNNTQADLTSVGGSKHGWVLNSWLYEIDIKTQQVIFSWSAMDHIPLKASKLPLKSYMGNGSKVQPFDFFHLNSIQAVDKDTLLINSRHTWACYLISRRTGKVLWGLDGSGEGGDFGPLPKKGIFKWQHHARAHNVTKDSMAISIFDNHNTEQDNGTVSTRGLVLGIQLPPNKEQVPVILRDLQTPQDTYADSQGSYQADLSNSNQLMGYGPIPVVREFGPGNDGKDLLWEGRFGHNDKAQSYRVFKHEWHATPMLWDPSLVIEKGWPSVRGYVSWNGATEVESWNVYRIWENSKVELIGKTMNKGFETKFHITGVPGNSSTCIMVGAVQGQEEVRQSNVACIRS